MAAKKAAAKKQDAYTRNMFGKSAALRDAAMDRNPDNKKAVSGDSPIMKKRNADATTRDRWKSYARLGEASSRMYNPKTADRKNGPVVEAKPSASVQKMLKKKK